MSLTTLIISGLLSLFLIILFVIEEHRPRRFLENFRSVFDRLLYRIKGNFYEKFPEVNGHFFQEFFYFLVHKVLYSILTVVRRLERIILRVVKFNRMQVARLRKRVAPVVLENEVAIPTTHARRLAEIMAHKKLVELAPHERTRRKEASLEGSGPF